MIMNSCQYIQPGWEEETGRGGNGRSWLPADRTDLIWWLPQHLSPLCTLRNSNMPSSSLYYLVNTKQDL